MASQSKGRRGVTLWTRDDLFHKQIGPVSVCLPLLQTNMLNSGLHMILKGGWTLAILCILVAIAASFVLWLLRKVLCSRAAAQPIGSQLYRLACSMHSIIPFPVQPTISHVCITPFFEHLLQQTASYD